MVQRWLYSGTYTMHSIFTHEYTCIHSVCYATIMIVCRKHVLYMG